MRHGTVTSLGNPIGISGYFVPRTRNIAITEAAVHEYIGILATRAGMGG